MKTEWNYSELAKAYVNRPDYSTEALDDLFNMINLCSDNSLKICDMGAGVAHLTIPLLKRGHIVDAVEPNDEMRTLGKSRTNEFSQVTWFDGAGENSGRPDNVYDIVTFGSSFNVTNRNKSLVETARILNDKGWFVCMWNHRNLDDPIQRTVENIIFKYVPSYDYGTRREDQTQIINNSNLFEKVEFIEGTVDHEVKKEDWIDAWRSHATLHRQAGSKFDSIVENIAIAIDEVEKDFLTIPYNTKIWFAKKK
jgi:ubiquinone/menaquinone biosynthesis C-methylase UbiE